MENPHAISASAEQNMLISKDAALHALTELYWSYDELPGLHTCHRLLGLINDRFKKVLPELLAVIDAPSAGDEEPTLILAK